MFLLEKLTQSKGLMGYPRHHSPMFRGELQHQVCLCSSDLSKQVLKNAEEKHTLTRILPLAIGNTKTSQPAQPAPAPTPTPINYSSSPSGYPPHGRYAPPSSMNMANMAYALPGHQSTGLPFEQQHHMHHYPATHAQGMMYPMQSMGHYPGQHPTGAVPYGIPYAPNFPPYAMPQHPGAAQHGGHYPSFVPNPSLQNMTGHSPSYGPGYYHPGYNVPYGPGALPVAAPMRQPSRQGSTSASRGSSSTSPSKRDVDRRTAEEYDVSKTIVDGSNPMKLAGPNASGKWF